MKLSEAIRLGAMLHPQCYGTTREWRGEMIVATCALGGAREAGYKDDFNYSLTPRCPAEPCFSRQCTMPLPNLLAHLNDYHRWTRERIADFMATLEPAPADDSIGEPSSLRPVTVFAPQ